MIPLKFAFQEFLLLLLCIPLMVYYFKIILRSALKKREQIFSTRNYASLANFTSRYNTTVKITIFLAAAALTIFAAARPQGLEKPEEIEASSIDICFAIDVSESMKALDLGRDNRLDITKAVVSHLIDNLKSDRVSIVAFSGEAGCVCPLTLDHAAAKSLLMQVDFDLLDKGGTRLDLAIKTAEERFDKNDEAARVIVLFTDGEDHDGRPVEAARQAYKNGIVIHGVGIGSKSGVKIPVSHDIWGNAVYKKFNGRDVVTKLNERVLIDITSEAGGDYFHVSDQNSLVKMIDGLKKIKKRALRVSSFNVAEELFAYFALAALILFIADSLIPARSIVKNTFLFLTAAFYLSFLLNTFSASGGKLFAQTPVPPVKKEYSTFSDKISQYMSQGAGLYSKNKYDEAEARFQSALLLSPKDIVNNYNTGCARYKNRDYRGAIEAFNAAAEADNQNTRFEPHYNTGNAYFKLSDYKKAIESYERALKIKPDDEDTLHNLELARKKLEEEMKKHQQNQKDQNSDNTKNKNDKNDKNDTNKNENKAENGENQQNSDNQNHNEENQDKNGTQKQENNENKKDDNQKEQNARQNEKNNDKSENNGAASETGNQNLADKQNIEKYKNMKIDPDRLKMFLKDLENDETRVQHLYQRNKKRIKKAESDDDAMDIFDMDPESLHEKMMRRMMGGERTPESKKKKTNDSTKDW